MYLVGMKSSSPTPEPDIFLDGLGLEAFSLFLRSQAVTLRHVRKLLRSKYYTCLKVIIFVIFLFDWPLRL